MEQIQEFENEARNDLIEGRNAVMEALRAGLRKARLPECAVSLLSDTSHASANELMTADGLVDLLIPRGGAGLIRACVENATVPCIQTGTGICHVYVDKAADLEMAVDIVENAKTSRPSVCNAEETLLIHKDVAAQFLPMLKTRLVDGRAAAGLTPVELHLDAQAAAIIDGVPAAPQDFDTEYLDYKLSVAVVDDVDAAILHIARHSTHHSPLYRRRRVWSGLRNGHQHPKAARPRPHGVGGAVYLQVHHPRQRPDKRRQQRKDELLHKVKIPLRSSQTQGRSVYQRTSPCLRSAAQAGGSSILFGFIQCSYPQAGRYP